MFSKKGNYLKFGLPFWIILILSCCDDIERWEREKAVGPLFAALRDKSEGVRLTVPWGLLVISNEQSLLGRLTIVLKIAVILPQNIWISLFALLIGFFVSSFLIMTSGNFLRIKVKIPGLMFLFFVGYTLSILIIIVIVFILTYFIIGEYFFDIITSFDIVIAVYNLLSLILLIILYSALPLLIGVLFLLFISIFNQKWFKAKKKARLFVCMKCIHRRFIPGPGLPWIVRWSGRTVAVEKPKKHEDFKDYFVCGTCESKEAKLEGVRQVIGLIDGGVGDYRVDGEKVYVNLWSEAQKKARNGDIDLLEIRNSSDITYAYAINAVLQTLKDDVSRPRKYVKGIPVILKGNPPLSENSRRILEHEFGGIQSSQP